MVEAEPLEHDEREVALLLDRNLSAQARVVHAVGVLGDLRDQRNEARLELVEDLTDGVGLETFVEVVQQDVVLALVTHVVEAVGVPVRELDVLLQVREEGREVGLLARFDPGGKGHGPGVGHLGAQVGWDALCLLVVAARDADLGCVVRVGIEALLVAPDIFEQLADLVVDEEVVRETVDRAQLLGPQWAGVRRHLRVLVPAEDGPRHAQVVDGGEACFELLELLGHGFILRSLEFRRLLEDFHRIDAFRVPKQKTFGVIPARRRDLGLHLFRRAPGACQREVLQPGDQHRLPAH